MEFSYLRMHDIIVVLPESKIEIKIPPLNVFKELKILELIQKLGNDPVDLKNKDTALTVIGIIETACQSEANKIQEYYKTNENHENYVKDILILLSAIINSVINPLILLEKDENYKKLQVETSSSGQHIENPFPNMALIVDVLMHLKIPEELFQYCGICFFRIAARLIEKHKAIDVLRKLSLFQTTGMTANQYATNIGRAWHTVYQDWAARCGIKTVELASNYGSDFRSAITNIAREVEKNGEAESPQQYWEKHWSKTNENN